MRTSSLQLPPKNATQVSKTADLSETYAALDLGSNSFHLIIARDTHTGLQVIDRYKESVRLAEGLSETGSISHEGLARGSAALTRFAERLRGLPTHNVRVVGTAALRTAKNRDQFLTDGAEILHHRIEVISGREEARLIHLGISYDLEDQSANRLIVDVGGGSTEFILGRSFRPRVAESLRMGCVLATDTYFQDGLITEKSMQDTVQAARQEMEVIERTLLDIGWDRAIGSSGTVVAVRSAIQTLNAQATSITYQALQDLYQHTLDLGAVSKLGQLGISRRRSYVFAAGLAILIATFEALDIQSMEVSSAALREGLLHDLLGRVHDEDIREQSVQGLLNRFEIDQDQASRVATTASLLFDQISDSWNLSNDEYPTMLRWAALLHEIGMNISHAAYHKHGSYLLNHLDLPGFSMHEQFVLATLVRAHRRNFVTPNTVGFSDLSKLAVLLRLAVVVHRNRTDKPEPPLHLESAGNVLSVRLPKVWLKNHRLTALDLEQEVDLLKNSPIQLRVSGN